MQNITMNNDYLLEPEKIRKERQFLPLGDNPISRYLNFGGRAKEYLSLEEKKALIKEYQWCNYKISLLEKKIDNADKPKKQQIMNKIYGFKNRINEVKEEIIVAYRYLVVRKAIDAQNLGDFKQSRLSIDDLLQDGSLGLIRKLNNELKNPKRGIFVEERVKWEIYQGIIKNIRGNIPSNLYFLLRRLNKFSKLNPKNLIKNCKKIRSSNKYASNQYPSLSLQEAKNVIMLYQGYINPILSYNDSIRQEEDSSNFTNEKEGIVQKNEIKEIVLENFNKLLPQQRLYVSLRLGTGKLLAPLEMQELMNITGLNIKEIKRTIKMVEKRYKLSLKESTICSIVSGDLNGKAYTKNDIKNILNVDEKWIKTGEKAIKELANNPVLKELYC